MLAAGIDTGEQAIFGETRDRTEFRVVQRIGKLYAYPPPPTAVEASATA